MSSNRGLKRTGFISIWAGVCVLLLCLAAPAARAQVIKDRDNWEEPIYLTSKNIGRQNLKDQVTWYRIEVQDEYRGYIKIETRNFGGKAVFTQTVKRYFGVYFYESEISITCEQGTLKPLKETHKLNLKDFKRAMKEEKEIYYDWKNKEIKIVKGEGNKKKVRTVKMEMIIREGQNLKAQAVDMSTEAVFMPAWWFYIREPKTLSPGNLYQFWTFDPRREEFTVSSFKVLGQSEEGIYEVELSSASAMGNTGETRIWVNPKSNKDPNGSLAQLEVLDPFSKSLATVVETSEDKAMNR